METAFPGVPGNGPGILTIPVRFSKTLRNLGSRPGRLLDHIGQRTIDLSHLEVLILDEADQMLDMGFLPGIRKILGHIPVKRQTQARLTKLNWHITLTKLISLTMLSGFLQI